MYGETPREFGCAAKYRNPRACGLSPVGNLVLGMWTSECGRMNRNRDMKDASCEGIRTVRTVKDSEHAVCMGNP